MTTILHRSICALLPLLAVATTSDADPRPACNALCGKMSSCKLATHSVCMKWCVRDPGADDPSTFQQAKQSCTVLGRQMAGSKWLCTAEGASSYGDNFDSSDLDSADTRGVYMMGTGATRAAAANSAIRDCNAILSFNVGLEYSMSDKPGWDAQVTSRCHITQCIAPAR